MSEVRTTQLNMTPTIVVRRSLAILAGALLVALGAQVAVPLPGTPVPMTLQVLAVRIVGGLMGPRLGAVSLAVYLAIGAAGLPVFAPGGALGVARLFGPTGGYLLAAPLAAAVVGVAATNQGKWYWLVGGLVAGTLVIHSGGVAQLAILSGELSKAVSLGSLPFLVGDILKILAAGLIVGRYGSQTRTLL